MTSKQITGLLRSIAEGRNENAIECLWETYYESLLAVVQRTLATYPVEDAEDATISGFNSFIAAAEAGRLKAEDRNELWKLLVAITNRKAYRLRERKASLKRKGTEIRETGQLVTEDFAERLMIETRDLLDSLTGKYYTEIVQMRLEGYTYQEIADSLGIAKSTVTRKLAQVRSKWSASF